MKGEERKVVCAFIVLGILLTETNKKGRDTGVIACAWGPPPPQIFPPSTRFLLSSIAVKCALTAFGVAHVIADVLFSPFLCLEGAP